MRNKNSEEIIKVLNLYKLSKYWNRIAYLVIFLGRKMIWDQTGRNTDILKDGIIIRPETEKDRLEKIHLWINSPEGKEELNKAYECTKKVVDDLVFPRKRVR